MCAESSIPTCAGVEVPSHFETKPGGHGVEECTLFKSGSVTFASREGLVTRLEARDAVATPAEWRGTWSSNKTK